MTELFPGKSVGEGIPGPICAGLLGLGLIDDAVFGLLGLLIAFTFTGGATRLEARRTSVTNQLNAVGTKALLNSCPCGGRASTGQWRGARSASRNERGVRSDHGSVDGEPS